MKGDDRRTPFDELADGREPLVRDWVFVATLDERTPLRVLQMDGRRANSLRRPATNVDPSQGYWSPVVTSFRDLGIDLDDVPAGSRATQFGPIEADGGDVLPFLIGFRTIVESQVSDDECFINLQYHCSRYDRFNVLIAQENDSRKFNKLRAKLLAS